MKKLLLTSPYDKINKDGLFPIGLAYLASKIDKKDLYLFDPNIYKEPIREAIKIVDRIKPDILGISLRNIHMVNGYLKLKERYTSIPDLMSFTKKIREKYPAIKIVIGGPGFTIFAKEIMEKLKEIDIGIPGEAEISFPEYLDNINNPSKVKGLLIRKGNSIHYTGNPKKVDVDSLEIPKKLDLLDLERYSKNDFIGIQTKRGCTFRCTYCTYPKIEGRSLRIRSPKKVVDEIENLCSWFNIKKIFFTDSVFNFPKEYAKKVCMEISKRKLDIEPKAFFRPDYIDPSFLEEAIKAGFKSITFSIDALSQKGLDTVCRELQINTILHSFRLVNEANLPARTNIFLDISCQDLRSTIETFKNIAKIRKIMGGPARVQFRFTRIRIYPHTPLYYSLIKKNRLRKDRSLLYPTYYRPSLYYYISKVLLDKGVIKQYLGWIGSILKNKCCRLIKWMK